MTAVTRQDIANVLGPVDEALAAEILRIGATAEEIAAARAWIDNEDALVGEGVPMPTGRVATLIEMLTAADDPDL